MASACNSVLVLVILQSAVYALAEPNSSIDLSDNNFQQILRDEWMVMFYAPSCPACQTLENIWKTFANLTMSEHGVKLGQVNALSNPALSGQFLIFSLPTIYHVKDGEFRFYNGYKSLDGLVSWLSEKQWRACSSLGWWRSPHSFHMKAIGQFFYFAHQIKGTQSMLTEDYGVPWWATYIIFCCCVVVCGLLLGLTVVTVTDCLFPQKPAQKTGPLRPSAVASIQTSKIDEGCEADGSGDEEALAMNTASKSGKRGSKATLMRQTSAPETKANTVRRRGSNPEKGQKATVQPAAPKSRRKHK